MQRPASKITAALWMAGWLSLTLVMAVSGREAMRDVSVFEMMELRTLLGFVLLAPLIWRAGGISVLKTSRLPQHITRNLVHYVAQLCWFLALSLIPIGQVVAIEFTMPVWTALLAASFLGERLTLLKSAAIALGLIGVLVIVRPDTHSLNPGQLIALVAALGFGISITLVKFLTRTEPTVSIIFWMMVIQSAAGLLPALSVWTWPQAITWGWIAVIGVCGTFSHFCMARAMLYADATIVIPMDFLRVPLTATAGWLLYSERLDSLTLLGAALILGGNMLNLRPAAPVPAAAQR
jgi:drug/metabolite transporter (DMT)-like permease